MMLKKQTVWLLTMLSLVVVLSVYYVTSPDGGSSNGIVMTENEEATNEESVDTTPTGEGDKEKPVEEEKPVEDDKAVEDEKAVDDEKDAKQPEEDAKKGEEKAKELEDGSTVISSVSSDELFATLRMELEDARNKRTEQLEAIVANSNIAATEINEAYDEMQDLSAAATKERILEQLIKAQGYDDALVRAEGDNVKITVKSSTEHSPESANKIIAIVRNEINTMEDILVSFQPAE